MTDQRLDDSVGVFGPELPTRQVVPRSSMGSWTRGKATLLLLGRHRRLGNPRNADTSRPRLRSLPLTHGRWLGPCLRLLAVEKRDWIRRACYIVRQTVRWVASTLRLMLSHAAGHVEGRGDGEDGVPADPALAGGLGPHRTGRPCGALDKSTWARRALLKAVERWEEGQSEDGGMEGEAKD